MTICLSLVRMESITVSVHSSSVAVWSCWILTGSGTQTHRSGASQTCSVAVRSVSVQAMKNWDVLSLQEVCRDPCSIMLQHELLVVGECLRIFSQCLELLSMTTLQRRSFCTRPSSVKPFAPCSVLLSTPDLLDLSPMHLYHEIDVQSILKLLSIKCPRVVYGCLNHNPTSAMCPPVLSLANWSSCPVVQLGIKLRYFYGTEWLASFLMSI